MSKLESRVTRLEEQSAGGDDFNFILVQWHPKVYQGSDGKRYGHHALMEKLGALGVVPKPTVSWEEADKEREPKPNTAYVDWGDIDA